MREAVAEPGCGGGGGGAAGPGPGRRPPRLHMGHPRARALLRGRAAARRQAGAGQLRGPGRGRGRVHGARGVAAGQRERHQRAGALLRGHGQPRPHIQILQPDLGILMTEKSGLVIGQSTIYY